MLIFLSYALLFIGGLALGSFLNVVIERSARGEQLTGRSHCDACGKVLSWRELIPVISFVYQKGRCRSCGAVLSVQYILIECVTGIALALIVHKEVFELILRGSIESLFAPLFLIVATASVIVVIVTDARYQIIPNGAVLALLIEGIAASFVRNGIVCVFGFSCVHFSSVGLIGDAAASVGSVTFLFCLWYFSGGRAMGFGDVKLIGATALMVGFPLSVVGLVFAFWLGGIWGIALLVTRKQGLKSHIAFGPFIIMGTVLAFYFGQQFLIVSGFRYLL